MPFYKLNKTNMLAINGVPMNQMDKSDPLVKKINDAYSLIRRKPKWKLVPHDSKVRKQRFMPGVKSSRIEYNGGVGFLTTGKYAFEGQEHDITYYTTTREGEFLPKRLSFSTLLVMESKSQADLIFFMTCVTTSCAPYPMLTNFQYIRPNSDFDFKVEDIVEEAKIRNEYNRNIAKVHELIFDDETGLDDDTLKNIAISQLQQWMLMFLETA